MDIIDGRNFENDEQLKEAVTEICERNVMISYRNVTAHQMEIIESKIEQYGYYGEDE